MPNNFIILWLSKLDENSQKGRETERKEGGREKERNAEEKDTKKQFSICVYLFISIFYFYNLSCLDVKAINHKFPLLIFMFKKVLNRLPITSKSRE